MLNIEDTLTQITRQAWMPVMKAWLDEMMESAGRDVIPPSDHGVDGAIPLEGWRWRDG